MINEREKKALLLDEACKPTPDVEKALKDLYVERKLDEKRLERKISVGYKCTD